MQKNEKKVAAQEFEPGTFSTKGRCPTHYTTVSLGKVCKKIKNDNIQCQNFQKGLEGISNLEKIVNVNSPIGN